MLQAPFPVLAPDKHRVKSGRCGRRRRFTWCLADFLDKLGELNTRGKRRHYAYRLARLGIDTGHWDRSPARWYSDDDLARDWLDNRLDNLRFLCPNCHSQTASWCGQRGRRRSA